VIDQEGYMARHEARGTMTDEQAEIVPFDVLQQHVRARFSEGGRQVNHVSVSRTGSRRRQLIRAISGATSSPPPDSKRMAPEARMTKTRSGASKERKSEPSPKVSASHHNREPTHTPRTSVAARAKVASAPLRPRAEKMPRKARMVIGLVRVKAKVDR